MAGHWAREKARTANQESSICLKTVPAPSTMDTQRMPAGSDVAMCETILSGLDPDEVRSDASHWSLEHDRSLSRDMSTVSGVEDG